MHADELDIDDDHVRRLIARQFPEWSTEPVGRLPGSGTVNAIFRIGTRFTARFPLNDGEPAAVEAMLRKEASALDELADCIPFPAPRHVAFGRPGEGYPLPWTVQTWLEGEPPGPRTHAAALPLARDLARVIGAMRAQPARGRTFRGAGRGGDLRAHDGWVARCIRESDDEFDGERLAAVWAGLRTLRRREPDAMVHGDLIPANLLVDGDHLAGVLDGGGFGPADPSLDLVCAWHLFDDDSRAVLREALAADELTWLRGAAWAFVQAMGLPWYYRATNPRMADLGRSTIARIMTDAETLALARP